MQKQYHSVLGKGMNRQVQEKGFQEDPEDRCVASERTLTAVQPRARSQTKEIPGGRADYYPRIFQIYSGLADRHDAKN